MKIILMTVMVLSVAAVSALASIGVEWTTDWGGYVNTAPNVTDYPSSANAILLNSSVIWQLVYSTSGSGLADPDTLAAGDLGDPLNEQVLATRTLAQTAGPNVTAPEDSTQWDTYMYNAGGPAIIFENLSWSTAGYVYQRVFQGTPADDSWYWESTGLSLNLSYNPMDPLTVQKFYTEQGYPGWAPGGDSGGFKPDTQINVVPEPATMSLLGLGALVMAIRRRRS